MKNIFIAIEGPIGVGKSTLARHLAYHFNTQPIEEIVYENPFLSDFYNDMDDLGFQTEMFFLTHRYKQLQQLSLTSSVPSISDYHIFKNMIFAKKTLSEKEFQMFSSIYNVLTEELPQPNILIILNASTQTLQRRIVQRGRSFESHIPNEYLDYLRHSYDQMALQFEQHHTTKVLRIDGDSIDFVASSKDAENIVSKVQELISSIQGGTSL